MKKTVLLGISSGIAAYKVIDLINLLKKDGCNVLVSMTRSASGMISPSVLQEITGEKVYIDIFEKGFDYKNILKTRKVDHITLADKTDLMVIVPATANIIAKLAHGLADDFVTLTALAVTAPIIVCPSMNVNMWNNPIVQENIKKLESFGYQIIEPSSGMLACGYEGKGRLENVQIIKEEILIQLRRTNSLKGKKIIVTAGGSIEKIDEVRFIANRSSGKMGIAIAEECYLRGAEVLLLRANNSVRPRYLINEEVFTTAADLFKLINKHVKNYDIFYHVAAVGDFKVNEPFKGKISGKKQFNLKLKPQIKILDQIKNINPHITLIAFKAEYGLTEKNLINTAYKRLKESKADAIIANDVGRPGQGFEVDNNEVYVILPDRKVKKIVLSSKRNVAEAIIDYLQK